MFWTRSRASLAQTTEASGSSRSAAAWNAARASASWVRLGARSGTTPDTVTVGVDRLLLPDGMQQATVTFTNQNDTRQRVDVEVVLVVQPRRALLPLTLK